MFNIVIIIKLRRNVQQRSELNTTRPGQNNRVTLLIIALCSVYFVCFTQISVLIIVMPYETYTGLSFEEILQMREYFTFLSAITNSLSNSYTMGCPPVRGDNPRALVSGLSYVQVDKHGITIL